jgi:RimJ/RimL family protein N-acetyltransferase
MGGREPLFIPFPLQLHTERLLLRSPEVDDAQAVYEAVTESLAELRPWMPWASENPDEQKTADNTRQAIQEWQAQSAFRIHLFDRTTRELVGCSGYPSVALDVPAVEIGYWIRTSRVGRGYCSEAVRALTDHAMRMLGCQRVEIRCDDRNVRSWRVAERVGFTLEGVMRRDCLDCKGRPRDSRVYSMLPEEWETQ